MILGAAAAGFYGVTQFGGTSGAQRYTVNANRSAVSSLIIPSSPPLAAHVRVNGAWTTMGQTAAIGVATGDSARYFFPHHHTSRIRRTGAITRVRVYAGLAISPASNYTRITVQIWRRRVGQRFDKIGETPNLLTSSAGIQDKTLTTPINVRLGDYYVVYVRKTIGIAGGNILALPVATNGLIKTQINTVPAPVSETWYAKTSGGSFNVEAELYMAPPQVVSIGYSQIEGHALQEGYAHDVTPAVDTTSATDMSLLTTGWDYQLFNTNRPGVSYENAGIGGQTAAQIIARASRDCFALKPRVAIVQMGGNDTDSSLVYTHMATFLDSCDARGIIPVVVANTPMTSKTNAQMFFHDRINLSLANLCASHAAGAIFVWMNEPMGQTVTTGTPTPPIGNLWDIKTAYDADGLHFDADGQAAFAQAIHDALTFDPTP